MFRKINPNYLTGFGLTLVPFMVIAHQIDGIEGLTVCLALLLLREGADIADGLIARRAKMVTDLGKLIDPLFDSIAKITLFFSFAASGWMDIWMLAIICLRDLFIAYVRAFLTTKGIVLAARSSGKYLHALPQSLAQILIIFGYLLVELGVSLPMEEISWTLLFIATMCTATTIFDYLYAAYAQINGIS